jgi:hypothetical protein
MCLHYNGKSPREHRFLLAGTVLPCTLPPPVEFHAPQGPGVRLFSFGKARNGTRMKRPIIEIIPENVSQQDAAPILAVLEKHAALHIGAIEE